MDRELEFESELNGNYEYIVKARVLDSMPERRIWLAYGNKIREEEQLKEYVSINLIAKYTLNKKLNDISVKFDEDITKAHAYMAEVQEYCPIIENVLQNNLMFGSSAEARQNRDLGTEPKMGKRIVSDRHGRKVVVEDYVDHEYASKYYEKINRLETCKRISNMLRTKKFYCENMINLYKACELEVSKDGAPSGLTADKLFVKNLEILTLEFPKDYISAYLNKFSESTINTYCKMLFLSPEQICGMEKIGKTKPVNYLLANIDNYDKEYDLVALHTCIRKFEDKFKSNIESNYELNNALDAKLSFASLMSAPEKHTLTMETIQKGKSYCEANKIM